MLIGYWLLATGYWLLATGYWLLATGYWLLATGYWLLATGYPQLEANAIKGTLKNSRCLCRTRKPRYVRVRNSVIIKAFEKRDL